MYGSNIGLSVLKVASNMRIEKISTEPGRNQTRFLFAIIIGFIWAIVFRSGGDAPISDPDIWWHIRSGQLIFETRSFPTVDSFSHTFSGKPWIAKEWLSQLIYYAVYQLSGWGGVLGVTMISAAIGGGLLFWFLSADLNPIKSSFISIVILTAESSTFVARPFFLTLTLILLWTFFLFDFAKRVRAPNYTLLIILFIWTNLHAGFTIGFLIAGFAFLNFIERGGMKIPVELRKWIGFLILCPVVALLNPYTWQPLIATLSVISPNEAIPLITEWQPFNPKEHITHTIVISFISFTALITASNRSVSKTALVFLLVVLFFYQFRAAFYTFALIPLILSPEISKKIPRWSRLNWSTEKPDAIEQLISQRQGIVTFIFSAALIIVVAASFADRKTIPPETISAQSAINFVKSRGLSGNVFNHYNFGGPLTLANIKTFIDGRTDQLFLGGFTRHFMSGPERQDDMEDMLATYKIGWTLLPPLDPRLILLDQMPGWQRIYQDSFAVVHAPVKLTK